MQKGNQLTIMTDLLQNYRKNIIPAMQNDFKIKNVMAVPKIEKAVINVGIGRSLKDAKAVEKIEKDIALLSGQKPVFTKAKKSIAGFKIREGMNVGLSVTLRGRRMYDFMDRFVNIALPRSRDFRGIDLKNFDKDGNLNIGIRESSIFPEVSYESIKDIFSFQITFVTNAGNKEKGIALFRKMGFPIKK